MKKKVFSLLLAGMLTFSMGTTAYATEDAIADMQAQKQQAEAGLAQTQANIDSLQSKKQELENYLSDLNTQYEDLTNAISELSIQAGEKENELKQLHTELKKAKKALNKQYDDMKLRIQYMYENGGTSALETLLSSKDLSEFLNNAESVAKISQYDRTMLEKCENLQNTIKDQETTAEEEKAAIDQLLEERAAKQQEVQNLAASTSDNISSYVSQISASQEEAAALTAEINNADNSIAQLVQQAEQEKAAREAAQAQAEAEAAAAQEQDAEENSDDYEEDTDSYEEDSSDSQDSSETEGSEPVYSAHLLEIIQKKCTDTLMVQRIQELVNIEQNVRNVAAHNIVSVTPEWIKERTGKSVDDIFWILKYVCEQVKINTRKENWNSYDSMNKRIIDELDKD